MQVLQMLHLGLFRGNQCLLALQLVFLLLAFSLQGNPCVSYYACSSKVMVWMESDRLIDGTERDPARLLHEPLRIPVHASNSVLEICARTDSVQGLGWASEGIMSKSAEV